MEYPVNLPGFEGRQLMVKTAGFFSGPALMIDGQPAPKGAKPGQVVLRRSDGTEVTAQLRTVNFVDPLPQLLIDNKPVVLAEPLKWYQWLWAGWPFALVFIGGLLGGLAGGIATMINGRIFRQELNAFAKYLLTGVISVAAVIAYFIAAIAFNLLITK